MTPQDIITDARYIINDTDASGYRQSNTELLEYVNAGIRECAILQPSLFSTVADHLCAISTCEQTLTFTNAAALVEVLCVKDGAALTPFDQSVMNAFNPGWRADTAGAAQQWSKFANDPLRFFIYPKAPGTPQTLSVRYVKNPTTLALTDAITELPLVYRSALIDYVVYRSESKDDEHVLSERAQAFLNSFVAKVKG